MNKPFGILGYLFLIVGGVYLDAPVFALLAMPLFLVGFIFLLKFYLDFIPKQKSKRVLSKIIIVLGTVILCGVLGYSSVEYNQFQVEIDRNTAEEFISYNWNLIMPMVALIIVASLLIYFGIRKSDNLNSANLLYVWMPILILVPFTLFLLKLATFTGFWLGG